MNIGIYGLKKGEVTLDHRNKELVLWGKEDIRLLLGMREGGSSGWGMGGR